MNIIKTKLPGVLILEPKKHQDKRGYFLESYNLKTFRNHGLNISFVQDNLSYSEEVGTLRGLHYQLTPHAQTKLISVNAGAIFDVVVDIRYNSPTYGQWIGEIISLENSRQLLVPKGYAHGYCTIQNQTQIIYKVDEFYSPVHDRGIAWNDPALAIDWPTSNPILSDKDTKHPMLADAEINFVYEG
ncbi:dTDP-4-dehydrorhamnose 3,5-epimerase [Paenibacillus sinopodophylli]|uniref:dTDP-4-dehydrorhamnose 3,5-epimerase n=1 Tax=Paenibacillus sinopodophylli TaxID=1837342 RepID=UPI00110CC2B8|nr:dTDP-4-dehydrorhamnose 3,5-epimerase [Paenibacillus sinopodophylli]